MSEELIQIIKKLRTKVSNMLGRAILTAIREEGGQMIVQVEGLSGEVLSGLEHRQQYGFRSKPPLGCKGITIAIGGDKEDAIQIIMDNKAIETSPAWADAESRQFDNQGARHRIFEGKHVIDAPNGLIINVDGTVYEFTAANMTTPVDVIAGGISVINHDHNITSGSSAPGPTTKPN